MEEGFLFSATLKRPGDRPFNEMGGIAGNCIGVHDDSYAMVLWVLSFKEMHLFYLRKTHEKKNILYFLFCESKSFLLALCDPTWTRKVYYFVNCMVYHKHRLNYSRKSFFMNTSQIWETSRVLPNLIIIFLQMVLGDEDVDQSRRRLGTCLPRKY